MKKKTLIIIGAVLAVFIVTNPSHNSFKEYASGIYPKVGQRYLVHRKANFFIFSIYTIDMPGGGKEDYMGVFGNFFKTGKGR